MPSHLSKIHSTKSKTLLVEPFGQRLLAIFTALSTFYVEHYTTKSLLCINGQQFVAKITLKNQQAL